MQRCQRKPFMKAWLAARAFSQRNQISSVRTKCDRGNIRALRTGRRVQSRQFGPYLVNTSSLCMPWRLHPEKFGRAGMLATPHTGMWNVETCGLNRYEIEDACMQRWAIKWMRPKVRCGATGAFAMVWLLHNVRLTSMIAPFWAGTSRHIPTRACVHGP